MPYLNTAPSAWVLPLKFDGGGYRAGGKAMFDSEGNLWVSRSAGRRRTAYGRGTPPSSHPTEVRFRRSSQALLAAGWKVAPSVPPSTPRATRGSLTTEASPSRYLTRT